ncbi:MAG: AtpZ/AtpI family protein [Methylococcales bacterium]|nr:AtpZ/AtpI family protein [Methylococcales bacterium]
MNDQKNLKNKIDNQVKRIKKADQDRPNLLSQSVNLSSLVLVMLMPIIAGLYLGHWLDGMIEGYSMHWTLSLLFVGIVIGVLNVYFLIKD